MAVFAFFVWSFQNVYLHSHRHNYPAGTKQQEVTRFPGKDNNDLWIVASVAPPPFLRGFVFGARIKLNHVGTGLYLHSHPNKYPTGSKQQEVTCCGTRDDNDWFIIASDAKFRFTS